MFVCILSKLSYLGSQSSLIPETLRDMESDPELKDINERLEKYGQVCTHACKVL